MKQSLAYIALLVNDYDEAIDYYTSILHFKLIQDIPMEEGKRWVLIGHSEGSGSQILLARAVNEVQTQAVGHQSGGRVFLFLYTDDFYRDYDSMISKGVEFVRAPSSEAYGMVAVFKDLYGNLWDLIEPKDGF
ncbi:MAG: VOC family protein [Saprospiraceae bacterium]|nr:VOC family protein [Saprospiraceae bacterium]